MNNQQQVDLLKNYLEGLTYEDLLKTFGALISFIYDRSDSEWTDFGLEEVVDRIMQKEEWSG